MTYKSAPHRDGLQHVDASDAAQHANRLEALGKLASGMAHDFGNELQVISGAVALISDPAEPDSLARGIHILNEVVERAGSVVRRLLAYAREDVLHTSQIEVADLLLGLQEVLHHTLPRQISVVVNTPSDAALRIWADKSQLQTVILNLANNARHAMQNGGVLILSASLDEGIELVAGSLTLPRSDYVRLDVADNGCGMSQATLARASEPFFTTKGPGNGTGLGLSMARGFAEQSGGALAITSAVREGTLVSIWLPVAYPKIVHKAQKPNHPPCTDTVGCNARGRNVVLVDDVTSVREVLARQLTKEGFQVVALDDAAAALGVLSGPDEIDVMITDFAMPGLSGDELIRRAHLIRPGLPMILLTGHPFECNDFLRSYRQRALVSLMSKPVSRIDILQAICAAAAGPSGMQSTKEATRLTKADCYL